MNPTTARCGFFLCSIKKCFRCDLRQRKRGTAWVLAIAGVAAAAAISAQAAVQIRDLADTSYWRITENRRNPGGLSKVLLADINGDSYPDLIMSAPTAPDYGVIESGMVYVRFGGPYATSSDFDLRLFDLTPSPSQTTNRTMTALLYADASGMVPAGVQIRAPEGGQRFGADIATGDFNGDGIADIAIGAPGPLLQPTSPGTIYVIQGRTDLGGLLNVTDEIEAGRAFSLTGFEAGDGTGQRLLFADLDHDTQDDLVASLPDRGTGGEMYIIGGRAFGQIVSAGLGEVPAPLGQVASSVAGERLGYRLASGDLDGDGRADLLAAAPEYAVTGDQRGRIACLRFPSGFEGTTIVPATISTGLVVLLPGMDSLRGISMAVADIDGDYLADLAVGLPGWPVTDEPAQYGRVYLSTAPWNKRDASGRMTLATRPRFYAEGTERFQHFGASLAFGQIYPRPDLALLIGSPGSNYQDREHAGLVFVTPPRYSDTYYGVLHEGWWIVLAGRQTNEELGTWVTTGDFDQDGRDDIFACAMGTAPFDSTCDSILQADWDACHANAEGARVFGFPGPGPGWGPLNPYYEFDSAAGDPDSGAANPTAAGKSWMMFE